MSFVVTKNSCKDIRGKYRKGVMANAAANLGKDGSNSGWSSANDSLIITFHQLQYLLPVTHYPDGILPFKNHGRLRI